MCGYRRFFSKVGFWVFPFLLFSSWTSMVFLFLLLKAIRWFGKRFWCWMLHRLCLGLLLMYLTAFSEPNLAWNWGFCECFSTGVVFGVFHCCWRPSIGWASAFCGKCPWDVISGCSSWSTTRNLSQFWPVDGSPDSFFETLLIPTIHLFSFCPFLMVMIIVAPKAPYTKGPIRSPIPSVGLGRHRSTFLHFLMNHPQQTDRNRNRATGNNPLLHRIRAAHAPVPNSTISLM